eukprot:6194153-Pleurochrysis_carterae.AAC.13
MSGSKSLSLSTCDAALLHGGPRHIAASSGSCAGSARAQATLRPDHSKSPACTLCLEDATVAPLCTQRAWSGWLAQDHFTHTPAAEDRRPHASDFQLIR